MNVAEGARRPILVVAACAYALVTALLIVAGGGDDKGLLLTFGVVIGLSLFVATAITPFYGLLVFLVLYFVRPFERYEALAGSRMLYYIGVTTIAVAIAQYAIRRWPTFVRHPVHLALAAYVAAYCWSSVQWGITDWLIPNFQGVLLIPLLTYLLIVNLVRSPQQHRALAWLLVLSVAYVAVTASYSQDMEVGERVKSYGHFADPNDLAMILVALLPLPFALFRAEGSTLRKAFCAVVIAYALYVIWQTDSRGGLVGLVGLSFFVLADHMPDRRVALPVLAVAGIVGMAFLDFGFARRGGGVTETAGQGSGYGRRATWQTAINMCRDKPLTGVGPHKFRDDARHYFPSWGDPAYAKSEAHSFFFQVVGELGLPGTAALLYLLFRFAYVAPLSIRRYLELTDSTRVTWHLGRALRNVVVGWILCGMFLTQAYKFSLFLVIAMVVAFDNMLKERYEAEHGRIVTGAFELAPFPQTVAPLLPSGGGGVA